MKSPQSLKVLASFAVLAGLIIPTVAQASSGRSGGHADTGFAALLSGHKGDRGDDEGRGDDGNDPGGDIDCSRTAKECHIDVTLKGASLSGSSCSSFDVTEGLCVGSSVRDQSGAVGWNEPAFQPRQGIQSSFSWVERGGGRKRDCDYSVDANAFISEAYIKGWAEAPNSQVFSVTDAWNRKSGDHWKTDYTGGKVGHPGGYMGIDYDRGKFESSVHLWGFLVRK